MTTLSFQLPVFESISVRNNLRSLTALGKVIVVLTADSHDPDFGSRLRPSVLIPPNVELSIFG